MPSTHAAFLHPAHAPPPGLFGWLGHSSPPPPPPTLSNTMWASILMSVVLILTAILVIASPRMSKLFMMIPTPTVAPRGDVPPSLGDSLSSVPSPLGTASAQTDDTVTGCTTPCAGRCSSPHPSLGHGAPAVEAAAASAPGRQPMAPHSRSKFHPSRGHANSHYVAARYTPARVRPVRRLVSGGSSWFDADRVPEIDSDGSIRQPAWLPSSSHLSLAAWDWVHRRAPGVEWDRLFGGKPRALAYGPLVESQFVALDPPTPASSAPPRLPLRCFLSGSSSEAPSAANAAMAQKTAGDGRSWAWPKASAQASASATAPSSGAASSAPAAADNIGADSGSGATPAVWAK